MADEASDYVPSWVFSANAGASGQVGVTTIFRSSLVERSILMSHIVLGHAGDPLPPPIIIFGGG